jgi:hypothetical protein
MTNEITKYGLILWLFIVGVQSIAVAKPSEEWSLETFTETERIPVIKYDGPRYSLTEADKASLQHARATNGTWSKPADMPIIHIQDGTILDLSGNDTITKRRGARYIAAFGGYGCTFGTFIAGVTGFGCGTGCITMSMSALSGVVSQQYSGNPHPDMYVWEGLPCHGHFSQHFGVAGTNTCSNTNDCCGYCSFIGYWDC